MDNKDGLWLFASGHSPSLESGVLFAAPQRSGGTPTMLTTGKMEESRQTSLEHPCEDEESVVRQKVNVILRGQ